jgi:outer membrane lipoprotein-sorting protein
VRLPLLFLLPLVLAAETLAQDGRQIIAEMQRRAQAKSQRYTGTLQVLEGKGKVADKRWVYNRLGSSGASKAVLKFLAPADVKGVALLIHNHPDRASDQWMWTPAVGRERRIALQDRSTRFFGTSFSFEDLEERDVDQADYKLLGEEAIAGVPCWKIESKPKRSSQYTYSTLWVRKDHYFLAQIESFKGGDLIRRITQSDPAQVQGIWTPRRIEVLEAKRNSTTRLTMDKLEYNVPMAEEDFTLQALRRE